MADKKGILIIGEHQDGNLKKITRELLSKGRALAADLGEETAVLFVGQGLADLAAEAGRFGADTVWLADAAGLATYSTEAYTQVVTTAVRAAQPRLVLWGATAFGRDLAPRVATRLGVSLVSECTGAELPDGGSVEFVRPVYAGKAYQRVVAGGPIQMATVRPNAFAAAEADSPKSPATKSVAAEVGQIRAQVLDVVKTVSSRPELTEAEVIVSGGRGLKGPEHFELVDKLADVLGAATGASRAAVDAGWRPHSHQVGQTGKVVSPTLYIALGISGAIQHLAGMGTSKFIVAVNKDPDAPIFKVASYGIVGDVFDVAPIMIEEFQKAKEA